MSTKDVLFRLKLYAKIICRQEPRKSFSHVIERTVLNRIVLVSSVKQQRVMSHDDKKAKTPKAAGETFLNTPP